MPEFTANPLNEDGTERSNGGFIRFYKTMPLMFMRCTEFRSGEVYAIYETTERGRVFRGYHYTLPFELGRPVAYRHYEAYRPHKTVALDELEG